MKGEMINKDYRAKGLHFRLQLQEGTSSGVRKKMKVERRYKDFEYLRQALTRAFPGCYIPKLKGGTEISSVASALGLNNELPSKYLEDRRIRGQCRSVEEFCEKIREYHFIIESGKYIYNNLINPYRRVRSVHEQEPRHLNRCVALFPLETFTGTDP